MSACMISMSLSLDNAKDRTCRDKQEETRKESLEGRGKGEAYPPQPRSQRGKGKPDQLPKGQWCNICSRKGHRTQACWWNSTQQQQQHQKQQVWHKPGRQQHSAAQAPQQSFQQCVDTKDQSAATDLTSEKKPMGRLEHKTLRASFEQTRVTTPSAYATPKNTIAQLESA